MIYTLWNCLTSTRLCFWTLNLLTVNLVIGGLYTNSDKRYQQINTQLLPDWLQNNIDGDCWWLISLMMLLTLLACNIAACSSQRMLQLWQRRHHTDKKHTLLLLCPTLMHLCFVFILSGHALSEFSGLKTRMRCVAGQQITIAATNVEVLEQHSSFHATGVLMGNLQHCEAQLKFTDNGHNITNQLQVLHPLWHKGVSYHLVMSSKALPNQPPRLQVIIKQDPGLTLIILGNTLMCLLMGGYFFIIRKLRHGDNV
ncbi:MAG: hypothetical protein J7K75_10850 [Desulfuromonas sp.]|nr:hypothetical protein [Desulfuromonas sp.]